MAVFLLGVMALYGTASAPPPTRFARAEILAGNYVTYRNLVVTYVERHPDVEGAVGLKLLSTPPGWRPLAPMGNRVARGWVAVWGGLSSRAERDAERDTGVSSTLGVAEMQGGTEVGYSEIRGDWFALPLPVPVGALVSEVGVDVGRVSGRMASP